MPTDKTADAEVVRTTVSADGVRLKVFIYNHAGTPIMTAEVGIPGQQLESLQRAWERAYRLANQPELPFD